MQGTIAQLVALTVHGNSILQKGLKLRRGELLSQNSTFRFCESVNFMESPSATLARRAILYAANPHGWFKRLKKEGVGGLRMSYGPSGEHPVPDRRLAGFVGGGGKWLIETRGRSSSDFWEPRWQLGDRGRNDKKIWRVSYVRVLSGAPLSPAQPDNLEQLRLQLKQCLEQIAEFSRSQNLKWFTESFESAMARLESPDPLADVDYTDLAPPGFLSPAAHQLLDCAQVAWVFGGMGSWNDLGFEGEAQARYEKVSEEFYQLLNRTIVAAANSSAL